MMFLCVRWIVHVCRASSCFSLWGWTMDNFLDFPQSGYCWSLSFKHSIFIIYICSCESKDTTHFSKTLLSFAYFFEASNDPQMKNKSTSTRTASSTSKENLWLGFWYYTFTRNDVTLVQQFPSLTNNTLFFWYEFDGCGELLNSSAHSKHPLTLFISISSTEPEKHSIDFCEMEPWMGERTVGCLCI